MQGERWTKDQTKLAFYLYCQLPYGKLHQGNPEIIDLAAQIDRTPSAVAMKLVNFASLDPSITETGRVGLSNSSALDREIWEEFNADWEGLSVECNKLQSDLSGDREQQEYTGSRIDELSDYKGETKKAFVEQRIKQAFFRRAVLSSYRGRCCLSGISESRLLIASHIVPWALDKNNRLNPRNGLCLSAIHDRAFDCGLISLTDDLCVCVSVELKRRHKEVFINEVLLSLEGRQIEMPEKFHPDPTFIAWHHNERFLSGTTG